MQFKGEEHESMIPFSELRSETQNEDSSFALVIRSVARSLNRTP